MHFNNMQNATLNVQRWQLGWELRRSLTWKDGKLWKTRKLMEIFAERLNQKRGRERNTVHEK